MRTMSFWSRWCRVTMIGRRPMNSGMKPYFRRSCGCMSLSVSETGLPPTFGWGTTKAGGPAAHPLFDDLLKPVERPTADEQDVGGVDLDEILVRVLAPALRRHVGDSALEDLQQRLLD